MGAGIYFGMLNFIQPIRLILSIREYHVKLVVKSDEGVSAIAIAFQEWSSGSGV